jgi:hypothetical protein
MLTVLTAILLFQAKHFVCDFVIQPYAMVVKKGIYAHPLGLLHAGLHCLGSIPALLMLTGAISMIAPLLAVEFLVHYHTDWLKAQIDSRLALDNRSTLHWVIFGLDQFIHGATNLGMVWAVLYLS